MAEDRLAGVVVWYKPENKYGFIRATDLIDNWPNVEVFVHQSALPRGVVLLRGQKITFELSGRDDRLRAEKVALVEPAPAD